MLVCPECRNSQREGAGVCLACGHRFPPGTDEVAEPRRAVKPRGSWSRTVLASSVLVVAACLYLVRPEPTDPVQPALDRLVQQVNYNVDLAGTLDPAIQAQLTTAAQATSGCGKVEVHPIPASALASQGAGGTRMTARAPAPEAQIAGYFKALNVDGIAIGATSDGQTYVVAVAWGCA
jgi:hypothetical protein